MRRFFVRFQSTNVTRRGSRAARKDWRAAVAWASLAALLWPSLSPLPWLALDRASAAPNARHDDESGATHGHRHHDESAPAGSPAHPLDHDCAQCQALAHLARCALPAPDPPCVGFAPLAAVASFIVPEPRLVGAAATPPPIRGPPTSA